jgi:hypothetical protein
LDVVVVVCRNIVVLKIKYKKISLLRKEKEKKNIHTVACLGNMECFINAVASRLSSAVWPLSKHWWTLS